MFLRSLFDSQNNEKIQDRKTEAAFTATEKRAILAAIIATATSSALANTSDPAPATETTTFF